MKREKGKFKGEKVETRARSNAARDGQGGLRVRSRV